MIREEDPDPPDIETVYQVAHRARNGFGGNPTISVGVTDEDEDTITGRVVKSVISRDRPPKVMTGTVVIQKDNVACWEEATVLAAELDDGDVS